MTPPSAAEEIFFAALEKTSDAERTPFVHEACAGNDGLRRQVERLLAAHARAGAFLERPVAEAAHVAELAARNTPRHGVEAGGGDTPAVPERRETLDFLAASQRPGSLGRLGHYEVLNVVGTGGMGIVLRAFDEKLRRTVALKVVRPGLASPGLVKRFTHESQILGRLHHPGIAQVYEAGLAADGQPFFAMEFVSGVSLDVYARIQSLTLPARLDLVARVCDAVQHAHDHGVIHRDLKPANILVDEVGEPKVLDFGVARAIDADLLTEAGLTRTGQLVGTPNYMSPEQVAADPSTVDHRTDVYALGVILFELAAHRLPHQLAHRPLAEAARLILEQDPPRLGSLHPGLRGEVETIVAKALEKDPGRRYPSAADLAADLRRWLAHEPIRARPPTALYHLRKFARRHKALVGGVAATVAALALGLVGTILFAVGEARQRHDAVAARDEALDAKEKEGAQRELAEARARESRHRLTQLHVANGTRLLDDGDLLGALPWLTAALALDQGNRAREERHRTRIAAALAQTPRLVHLWQHDHEVEHVAFSPDGRRIVTASKDHTARVWDARTGKAVTPPLRHGDAVRKAAFSPDGRRVVTASLDRTARVWDARTGQAVSPALPHDWPVEDVSFSPDGRWVATASTDGTARLWDAVTGQPRTPPLKHASWVHSVSFSPDGRHVVTASEDRTAQVWDATTGQPTAPPMRHGAAVMSAAFSPDGRQVVTASEDRTARLWDAATSQPVGPPLDHGDRVLRAVFSPDGRYVSTCSYDRTARVWDAATGRAVSPPMKHPNSVRCAPFSPDGRYVVTASHDHTARVWEAATGEPVTPPLRHSWLVSTACFSPDGRYVVTASADWTARMWEVVGRGEAPLTLRHGQSVYCTAFSPDGRSLVTASADGTAQVWSAVSGKPVTGPLRHDAAVGDACFSPDGRRVLTASDDGTARLWDAATGRALIPPLRHLHGVVQATFSPAGDRVLTASADGTAQVWDAHTGAALGPRFGHRERLYTAAFSPDGRRVVTASGDGTARVWDAATGAPRTPPLEHQGPVEEATFNPDGRRVVTASADYSARVWDAETGTPLTKPLRHGAGVSAASFSPDGRRVVTGSRQGTARVWDAATGAPVTPLLKHGWGQIRVAFSPDGRRLATGGGTYTAQLWDAATGESLGPPLRHRGWVHHLAFSPDGQRLATASQDGTARVWNLPGPDARPLEDLVLLAQVLSTQRVDATDGLVEVEPAAQRRALEQLRSRYATDFAVSVPEALAWHRREAEACLREKNGPAALFHLLHSRWDWWLLTR